MRAPKIEIVLLLYAFFLVQCVPTTMNPPQPLLSNEVKPIITPTPGAMAPIEDLVLKSTVSVSETTTPIKESAAVTATSQLTKVRPISTEGSPSLAVAPEHDKSILTTNPKTIEVIAQIQVEADYEPWDISVENSIAYVACGDSGLCMHDVSDPSNPINLGSFDLGGQTTVVEVVGDKAYLAVEPWSPPKSRVVIIDISQPNNLKEIGVFEQVDLINNIEVIESVAYIAAHLEGLILVDVSNPSIPSKIGVYNSVKDVQNVLIVDNIAYVAAGIEGLRIVDVSEPATPKELGAYLDYPVGQVIVTGNTAYVTTYRGNTHIVDISDLTEPREIGVDLDWWTWYGGGALENIIYGSGDDGFRLVNVTVPAKPERIGLIDSVGGYTTIKGNIAYVVNRHVGLTVLSIEDAK